MNRSQPLRRTAIRPMSAKRRRENKQRRANVLATFGTDPACVRCGVPADDAHELKRRSQGGSLTDTAGIVPLCRGCHSFVTENQVAAHAEGLHRWSWEDDAA